MDCFVISGGHRIPVSEFEGPTEEEESSARFRARQYGKSFARTCASTSLSPARGPWAGSPDDMAGRRRGYSYVKSR